MSVSVRRRSCWVVSKARQGGRSFEVGGREEIDEPPHLQQRLDVVVVSPVGDGGTGGVHLRPPSSSAVTVSLVTVFTTSGPVTNM